MSWNYRVLRRTWPAVDFGVSVTTYTIHEIYYDASGNISSWTVNPIEPIGETIDELQHDINHIIRATVLPVLEENGNTLVEIKE